jgi:AcrR family transcriptional regulator
LIDAMIACIGVNGYAGTPVADLIEEAGVSRKTFYHLFPNREALLTAAFESSSAGFYEMLEADPGPRKATHHLEALMRHLCARAEGQPGLISLWSTDIAAAGDDGFHLREGLMDRCAALIEHGLEPSGHDRSLPRIFSSTLAGALHREIDARMRDPRRDGMPELPDSLTRWTRSYHPMPANLEVEPENPWPWMEPDGLVGGRAPGTLTLAPNGALPRIGISSAGFRLHANRERILDALAVINAESGYGGITAEAIIERSEVPESVFRSEFKNSEQTFLAALELGHTKAQAIIERSRIRAPSFPESVRTAIHALLEFFAAEPYFTRLAFIDAPLARPATARRTLEHAKTYASLLFNGAPQRRKPPAITGEAIVQGLFELAYCHAERDQIAKLPSSAAEATYLALAPFIGADQAGRLTVMSG